MRVAFPEPADDIGDTKQVLLGYLDFFRSTVAAKVTGVDHVDLRRSVLPSGWTLLELVKHLTHMERRWFEWGFLAVQVGDPYGDADDAGRWYVDPAESPAALLDALSARGRRTREIVSAAKLSDRAEQGGRFRPGELAPTLERILLHVLQEYARHVGHVDVARELIDGSIGE